MTKIAQELGIDRNTASNWQKDFQEEIAAAKVIELEELKIFGSLDEFYLDASEALDILVYTPKEFEDMKEIPFIGEALKEGRILH